MTFSSSSLSHDGCPPQGPSGLVGRRAMAGWQDEPRTENGWRGVARLSWNRTGGPGATKSRHFALPGNETAVNDQLGASNKRRFIRGQKQHAIGHFNGLTNAA
jgi:hypothetical protein